MAKRDIITWRVRIHDIACYCANWLMGVSSHNLVFFSVVLLLSFLAGLTIVLWRELLPVTPSGSWCTAFGIKVHAIDAGLEVSCFLVRFMIVYAAAAVMGLVLFFTCVLWFGPRAGELPRPHS